MKTISKILLLIVLSSASIYAQTAPADSILGTWLTPNQTSEIAIVKCGDDYCGSIQSMKDPKNDEKNPDPALRGRPLIGVQVLSHFHYTGPNTWSGGTLYGPERGREFSPTLVLASPDSLEIRVKAGMMSKTIAWTRKK